MIAVISFKYIYKHTPTSDYSFAYSYQVRSTNNHRRALILRSDTPAAFGGAIIFITYPPKKCEDVKIQSY